MDDGGKQVIRFFFGGNAKETSFFFGGNANGAWVSVTHDLGVRQWIVHMHSGQPIQLDFRANGAFDIVPRPRGVEHRIDQVSPVAVDLRPAGIRLTFFSDGHMYLPSDACHQRVEISTPSVSAVVRYRGHDVVREFAQYIRGLS